MIDFLFISTFFFSLLSFFILFRISSVNLFSIDLISISFIALIVFSFIGTYPLYFYWDSFRVAIGITDKLLITKVMLLSSLNIIFFMFGVIFFKQVIKVINNSQKFSLKIRQQITPAALKINNSQVLFLLLLFIVCLLTLYIYINKIDKLAIVAAFIDGYGASKEYRSEMGANLKGYHWFKLIMYQLGNFLCFCFYALYKKYNTLIYRVLFIISFTYSVFIAVMATEKAPLVYLVIGLFFTHILIFKNGLLDKNRILGVISLLLIVLITFYIIFMGATSPVDALTAVFSRAFTGSIAPAYFYLQFFPEIHDYVPMATWPNPGRLLPVESFRYTVEVANWKFPDLELKGVVGSMPTVFWGEAYANFGVVGVPLIAFVMGIYITVVNAYFKGRLNTVVNVAGYVWVILFFKDISITGFSHFIISVYFIFFIIMMSLFNLISKRFNF